MVNINEKNNNIDFQKSHPFLLMATHDVKNHQQKK
jgi:hypothetical protein